MFARPSPWELEQYLRNVFDKEMKTESASLENQMEAHTTTPTPTPHTTSKKHTHIQGESQTRNSNETKHE